VTVVVSTMILNSLIANGEKSIGGSLSAGEQSYYLGKLNAMLESWSLERTLCYQVLQENFALTAGDGSYTIGSGADFNTARPTKILGAFIRDSSNSDSPVKVVPYDAYDAISSKNVSGSYPTALYYDQAFDASGFATINLYPLPKSGLTLFIDSAKQLQSFGSVTTALLMPPGYQRAIESNFSIETAPGLRAVAPEIVRIAREAKAAVAGVNLPETVSRLDSALVNRSTGNILEGP
jgi:hypothetical protein